MDVWLTPPGGETLGRVALELELVVGNDGRPGTATLRLLGPCEEGETTDCTTVSRSEDALVLVMLTEPAFSGEFWEGSEELPVVWNLFLPDMATFVWPDLLAGTRWVEP